MRKIGIHFTNNNEEVWFYSKLDDLQERLEKSGFVRCH
ncbi:MAG: hypothetical protein HFH66_16045 [Lachnospiraceae bacterium]|nr:hypothetical protein [Lachnospiraceae bacterium]